MYTTVKPVKTGIPYCTYLKMSKPGVPGNWKWGMPGRVVSGIFIAHAPTPLKLQWNNNNNNIHISILPYS